MIITKLEFMVKTIEKLGRIVKVGNSKGVIIDKDILEYLNLDIGDAIKLTIEKVEELKPRIREHKENEDNHS